jgi:hypothetical protein
MGWSDGLGAFLASGSEDETETDAKPSAIKLA